MDKIEIIAYILSIIVLTIIIGLLLYPIWGIILIMKIIQISIVPPMIWWLIHTLAIILWLETIKLLIQTLKEIFETFDRMDRLNY